MISASSTVGRGRRSGHPQPESLCPFTVLALLRRLLLLPLLSPLLAALLLAALNPRPNLALRLLIWTTPPLPIGLWIGIGASGGALLSASAAALALQQGGASQRRSGRRRPQSAMDTSEPWSESWQQQPAPSRMGNWFTRQQEKVSPAAPEAATTSEGRRPHAGGAGPQRPPGEPAPTVAVPFRVLHRPGARSTAAPAPGEARTEPATAVHDEPQPEAVAVADDWGQNEADDW